MAGIQFPLLIALLGEVTRPELDLQPAPPAAHVPKTVILGSARTPIGKMGGGLSSLDATDLGGTAISEALDRAEVKADEVQGVVYGQVLQAGQGQIPSRQAQIKGGIPKEVRYRTRHELALEMLAGTIPVIAHGDVWTLEAKAPATRGTSVASRGSSRS